MLAEAGQENQQKETKVTKGFMLTTQIESSFSSLPSVRNCDRESSTSGCPPRFLIEDSDCAVVEGLGVVA